MSNIFAYNSEFPAHVSIGAVVLNDNDEIMCHHFRNIKGYDDLYILMRETPEEGESIEKALSRGLAEEFGAKAEIVHYLGSIVSKHQPGEAYTVEKTTLYFLCNLREFKPETRLIDDPESGSEIQFLAPTDLVAKMAKQATRDSERSDFDERAIIRKLVR